MWRKVLLRGLAVGLVLLVAIQLVPLDRTNPSVQAEPAWDTPRSRELAQRACFDCHSNQTTWPWYSSIAPVSWLVVHDVNEGREKLNFSAWTSQRQSPDRLIRELQEVLREGEMPPASYLLLHPDAKLSPEEQQALSDGLAQTVKASPPGAAQPAGDDEDEDDD